MTPITVYILISFDAGSEVGWAKILTAIFSSIFPSIKRLLTTKYHSAGCPNDPKEGAVNWIAIIGRHIVCFSV